MINLTKYFSQALNQIQMDSQADEQAVLITPWKTINQDFVKHFPISIIKIPRCHSSPRRNTNPESQSPSRKNSSRSKTHKRHKSLKTYPEMAPKKNSLKKLTGKRSVSTKKLPFVFPESLKTVIRGKGEGKGLLRQTLEVKRKQNKSSLEGRAADRAFNLFRINQYEQTLLERKNELIKPRAPKPK